MSQYTAAVTLATPPALTPAREALARAISDLAGARERFEVIAGAVAAIRSEAEALGAQIAAHRAAYEAHLAAWMRSGADGPRPAPADELLEAEQRLATIAAPAAAAAARIAADDDYGAALRRLQDASRQRDSAVWPAAVEAAEPLLSELAAAAQATMAIEMRLDSLVLALREAGRRDPGCGSGAMRAAWTIEQEIRTARHAAIVARDPLPGRALIEGLRVDALTAL